MEKVLPPEAFEGIDEGALGEWTVAQRWFGAKGRDPAMHLLEVLPVRDSVPLAVALVEARFAAGTHDLYQLLLATTSDGQVVFDGLAGGQARALAGLLGRRATVAVPGGEIRFEWVGPEDRRPTIDSAVRSLGAEQSNSTVVIDEDYVLKVFRRLEPGVNPELEMLRFLSARGFSNVARLVGWYELQGDLLDATLGVAQEYVAHGRDGWELVLAEVGHDPDRLVERVEELGSVIGRMHTVLGSDVGDTDFAPEEPSVESSSLLTATIDEQIERTFLDLPSHPFLEPIAGRGDEIRERLSLLSRFGAAGRLIRTHGDLHLGQTLWTPDRWIVIDFEGEPARPLLERRRKRSPLRDVAGMLRSISYAAVASELQRGVVVPDGWEERARASFLHGYLASVEPTLVPSGDASVHQLLSIFELEKAVYELRYEVHNRPDWVLIPVAGIARLLEADI